ncbi:MAG TPA: agarase, partial [Candidatus Hydrogenedentes bacterium]|nr:agarase [Candidatus Hydrogenedentota bacterium]
FHTGLVAAASQDERAALYENYLRAAALHPKIVGTHWFQLVDQPITGRWYDGENYNIGMLSVVDHPYPELTGAARRIHGMLYPLRAGKAEERTP